MRSEAINARCGVTAASSVTTGATYAAIDVISGATGATPAINGK